MEPNQQNQGNQPLFSPSNSLFGNNAKNTNNQQQKPNNNTGLFSGASQIFSPHTGQAPAPSIFGNIANTGNAGSIFGGPGPGSESKSIFPNLASQQNKQTSALFGNFTNKQTNQQKSQSEKQNPLFGIGAPKSEVSIFSKQSGAPSSIFNNSQSSTPFSNVFGNNKPVQQNKQEKAYQQKKQQAKPVQNKGISSIFTNNKQSNTNQQKKQTTAPIFGGNLAPSSSLFSGLFSNQKNNASEQKQTSSIFSGFGNNPLFGNTKKQQPAQKKPQQQQSQIPIKSLFSNQILPNATKKQEEKNQNQQKSQMKKLSLFGNPQQNSKLSISIPAGSLFSNSYTKVEKQKQSPSTGMPSTSTHSQNKPITTLFPSFNNASDIKKADSASNASVQGSVIVNSQRIASIPDKQPSQIGLSPSRGEDSGQFHSQSKSIKTPTFEARERSSAISPADLNLVKNNQQNQQINEVQEQLDAPSKLNPSNDLFKSQKIEFSRPPMPPKSTPNFKPTFQKNVQPSENKQQKEQTSQIKLTQKKSNLVQKQKNSFNDKQKIVDKKINSQPSQNKKMDKNVYFNIFQLIQFLSTQPQSQLLANAQKIQNSFRKYLQIKTMQSNQNQLTYVSVSFIASLTPKQGINKFLNDFTQVICNVFRVNSQSYEIFGHLFFAMLKQYQLDSKLFNNNKMNEIYFLSSRMYKVSDSFTNDGDGLILQVQETETTQLLCEFIRYFSTLIVEALRKIQNLVKIFKKTTIYQLFLQTSIMINLRYPKMTRIQSIQTMRQNDLQQILHLNKIINNMLDSKYFTETNLNLQIISKECIAKLIPVVDQLPLSMSTKIFQKILLKFFTVQKFKQNKNYKQLIQKIQKTNNKIFIPFRVILHKLDKSRKKIDPFQKQLFQQINGPQWTDWMSLYLGQQNIKLKQKQMQYLIGSLKAMKIRNIDIIINKDSQINRMIHIMRQQNQIKNFYQALSSIIYSQSSIQKVQKQYFKQDRTLNDDLRLLADQIRRYPNCQYNEQDMPQLHAKSLYFLTSLAISPQRAFTYENALFDMMGFMDVQSDRCDRVCHLVIDLFGYFSNNSQNYGNQQIVGKVFQAIISLMDNAETKKYMNLAMNINRPQFQFFNKNLPVSILNKISTFLLHLLSSQQFYNSTHAIDYSILLAKAYPFRYAIEKYLSIIQSEVQNKNIESSVQNCIPLYWFSNCIKFVIKNYYNPELIQAMLSKLKIYPSNQAKTTNITTAIAIATTNTVSPPFILSSIVQAVNSTSFFPELLKHIQASVIDSQGRITIVNNLINQSYDYANAYKIFYSVNLLKCLLQLRSIRNKFNKLYNKHYSMQLIGELYCLGELDRSFMQVSNQISLVSNINKVPSVISLLSLVCQISSSFSQTSPYTSPSGLSSPWSMINPSSTIKIQWVYSQYEQLQLQNLKRLHSNTAQNIDYFILRDPLVHPYYEYSNNKLECYQNISSISLYCLTIILQQIKQISLQGLLYMCMPKKNTNSTSNAMLDTVTNIANRSINNHSSLVQYFGTFRNDLIKQFSKLLSLSDHSSQAVCQNAWKFILTLHRNPLNAKLSQQIFKYYVNSVSGTSSISHMSIQNLHSLCLFILYQADNNIFIHSQILLEIIAVLPKIKISSSSHYSNYSFSQSNQVSSNNIFLSDCSQILQKYSRASRNIESLHQFERLIQQRKILHLCQCYTIFKTLFQIVLKEMYAKLYVFPRHCYGLIEAGTQMGVFGLVSITNINNSSNGTIRRNSRNIEYLDADNKKLIIDIVNSNIPRLYGPDILQIFISSTLLARQDLISIQIQNVLAYHENKLQLMQQECTKFLSTILSLNKTLYSNHPISLLHLQSSAGSSSSSSSSSSLNNLNVNKLTKMSNVGSVSVYSQLFCQYHLGIYPYKAVDLLGIDYNRSMNNCKILLSTLLNKVSTLKNIEYNQTNINNASSKTSINNYLKMPNFTQSRQIIDTYMNIDALINWFKANINININMSQSMNININEGVGLNSYSTTIKQDYRSQTIFYCKQILRVCFSSISSQPVMQPVTAKLLLDTLLILIPLSESQLSQDLSSSIKQSVLKTITSNIASISSSSSTYTFINYNTRQMHSQIKQQLLTVFLLLPPLPSQLHMIEIIVNIWLNEQNYQYFYVQSALIYKLSVLYPLQMCKLKILSKNQRVNKFQVSTLQAVRYNLQKQMRSTQTKCWLWMLKIATALFENGSHSTMVVNEVGRFVYQVAAKRMLFTFGQFKNDVANRNNYNNKTKTKDLAIKLTLAQLQQLQASLQLYIVLSQSKMWVQMNRQFFQQCLYYLLHRSIIIFAPGSIAQKLHKRYIPQSLTQKLMWKLQSSPTLLINQGQSRASSLYHSNSNSIIEGYDPDRLQQMQQQQQILTNRVTDNKPNIFILLMSIKFNHCLKNWLLACSHGMRMSCFVREYFSKNIISITTNNNQNVSNKEGILRYSLTHWDHLNRAITQIIQGLTNRSRDWGRWQEKKQLIDLLNDSSKSAEFFTETGYISTLSKLPSNFEQLMIELGQSLSFAFQLGACHLVSQISFRNINGTFSKQSLQGFQEKLLRLCKLGQQKLMQNMNDRQSQVFEDIKYAKNLLLQIKYD